MTDLERDLLTHCGSLCDRMAAASYEIERLTSERDEAQAIAIDLYRFLAYHEATPDIDDSYGWLREAAEKASGE